MNITKEEVLKVAHLARLTLSEEELDSMTSHLDTILSYVIKLDELDTSGVQPITHAFAETNAFREDRVSTSLARAEALANGPCHNEEAFVVPKII